MKLSSPEVISFANDCKMQQTDVFFCLPKAPTHQELRRFAEGLDETALVLLPGAVFDCGTTGITVLRTQADLRHLPAQRLAYMDIRLFAEQTFPAFFSDSGVRLLILPFYECAAITEYGFRESYMAVAHARASVLFPLHIVAVSGEDYLTPPVFDALGTVDYILTGEQSPAPVQGVKTVSPREKLSFTAALCEKSMLKQTIVQCPTRTDAETLQAFLRRRRTPASLFHGGKPTEQNRTAVSDYSSGKVNILIATKSLLASAPFLCADQILYFGLPYSLSHARRCASIGRNGSITCIWCDDDLSLNRRRLVSFYKTLGMDDAATFAAVQSASNELFAAIE